jgi:hypothetical protein
VVEISGTREGDRAEIEFVRDFNRGRFVGFTHAHFPGERDIVAVRVTSHKYSSTSKSNVKPKSDVFLVSSNDLARLLGQKGYYLDESDLERHRYRVINGSGISVKKPNSRTYQIHKFTPQSFLSVFGDRFLGAGALVYIDNVSNRSENQHIIEAWGISVDEFLVKFSRLLKVNQEMLSLSFSELQKYCLTQIKNLILDDQQILELVFTGRGVFDPPFFVNYGFIGGKLEPIAFSDFYVTQGSNRKANPTIVIKPKLS